MPTWSLAWPDGKPTALTFSFDDGQIHDVRLIEIFNKHGLKGTFNLNSGVLPPNGPPAKHDAYVKLADIAKVYAGHEVAAHGLTHAFMTRLNSSQRCVEVVEDRKALEAQLGYPVTGFVYAFGDCNAEVARDVAACGISYARGTSEAGFNLPENWHLWCGTCHQTGFAAKLDAYEKARWPGQQFYVWGHSYEFPADNSWDRFDAECARAVAMNTFWPATNMEIYQYVQGFRRLEFGIEGRLVRNPTGRDLWIARGHRKEAPVTRVPANSILTLE